MTITNQTNAHESNVLSARTPFKHGDYYALMQATKGNGKLEILMLPITSFFYKIKFRAVGASSPDYQLTIQNYSANTAKKYLSASIFNRQFSTVNCQLKIVN
jgi:hypothetical protein